MIVLDEQHLDVAPDTARNVILEVVRSMGLTCLTWSPECRALRVRSEWLRRSGHAPAPWPDLSDEGLTTDLAGWLGPHLDGVTRKQQLERLDTRMILKKHLGHRRIAELDRLAPATHAVPTGSRITLEYDPEPVLAVKLQEMFGEAATPAVAGGTVPVLIHLLSPAGRPLAVTRDLPSFWKNVYPEVRKEMRGRYPKHPWPEDPMTAQPTRRTKKRGR
jgi:ATP-dependent helicase HrpB